MKRQSENKDGCVPGVKHIIIFGGFTPADEVKTGMFKADTCMYSFDAIKNAWSVFPQKLQPKCVTETLVYCASTQFEDGSVIVIGCHPKTPVVVGFQMATKKTTVNRSRYYSSMGAFHGAARADASLIALKDGRIMRIGGMTYKTTNDTTVAISDKQSIHWKVCTPEIPMGAGCYCVVLTDGNVLITGGHIMVVGSMFARTVCVLYNVKDDTFRATAHMAKQRAYHAGCLLRTGEVFVCGGMDSGGTCEVFDPATEKWKSLPDMLYQRMSHKCELLEGGQQVFIFGGATEHGQDMRKIGVKCEFYNTDVNTFTPAPDMLVGKAKFFTITE